MTLVRLYRLRLVDQQTLDLPMGSEILSCRLNPDVSQVDRLIDLWVRVHPSDELVTRTFRIVRTNQTIESDQVSNDTYTYVGQVTSDSVDWLVFVICLDLDLDFDIQCPPAGMDEYGSLE